MDVFRQVLAVLIVFILLGAAVRKLRRGGNSANFRIPWNGAAKKGRLIEPVEKLTLTPQHALHLVRVEGRQIIIATHPQGCTLIEHTARERVAGA